jgi:hypothetical protein
LHAIHNSLIESKHHISRLSDRSRLSIPHIDARILSDVLSLFSDFSNKQLGLLNRGSQDRFDPSDFQRECDGHGNTLTIRFTTEGSLFGGFNDWSGTAPAQPNVIIPDPHLVSRCTVGACLCALHENQKQQVIDCDPNSCVFSVLLFIPGMQNQPPAQ